MAFFKIFHDKSWTPSEVWQNCFDESTPITSVRRSITNLEKRGELEQTKEQREGFYGKPNYTWRLAKPKEYVQAQMF